jgi:paraquat-inducible protein A
MWVGQDPDASFRCPRCGYLVQRSVPGATSTSAALYLAAALLFITANAFPVVAIEAAGNRVEVSLAGAARALVEQQMGAVGLVVFITTILVPAIDLMCVLCVLALSKARYHPGVIGWFLRARDMLRPWSMVEIFVLGSLVAIVKLGSLASVVLGPGIWSLAGFVVLSAAATHVFDPAAVWESMETPS